PLRNPKGKATLHRGKPLGLRGRDPEYGRPGPLGAAVATQRTLMGSQADRCCCAGAQKGRAEFRSPHSPAVGKSRPVVPPEADCRDGEGWQRLPHAGAGLLRGQRRAARERARRARRTASQPGVGPGWAGGVLRGPDGKLLLPVPGSGSHQHRAGGPLGSDGSARCGERPPGALPGRGRRGNAGRGAAGERRWALRPPPPRAQGGLQPGLRPRRGGRQFFRDPPAPRSTSNRAGTRSNPGQTADPDRESRCSPKKHPNKFPRIRKDLPGCWGPVPARQGLHRGSTPAL
ncbi:MAG: hypothetical protein PVG14_14760, partial [Anaerolineales bacterium]